MRTLLISAAVCALLAGPVLAREDAHHPEGAIEKPSAKPATELMPDGAPPMCPMMMAGKMAGDQMSGMPRTPSEAGKAKPRSGAGMMAGGEKAEMHARCMRDADADRQDVEATPKR